MAIDKITAYRTSDGATFEKYTDAQEHERNRLLNKRVNAVIDYVGIGWSDPPSDQLERFSNLFNKGILKFGKGKVVDEFVEENCDPDD